MQTVFFLGCDSLREVLTLMNCDVCKYQKFVSDIKFDFYHLSSFLRLTD